VQLKELHLRQFKNHVQADFEFQHPVICFTGKNGIGKTNVLDAIYYLCLTKSYFLAQDSQNISNGTDFFVLEGLFEKQEELSKVLCKQPLKGKKEFSKNKVIYDKLSEHVGQFPVVMITPYDVELIQEGSEIRRRFMDAAICQIDKGYLQNLVHYQKVLVQRNALLKQLAEYGNSQQNKWQVLDTYDEQLVQYGKPISDKRKQFLPELFVHFQTFYHQISGGQEAVNIHYESTLLQDDFASLLIANRSADLAAQRTLIGIHKDDINFEIKGFTLRKFGSQGQQKSFLLALKFAQWQLTKQYASQAPILLLDDLFDRMDEHRIKNLIQLFKNFGQVFITDTHPERLEKALLEMEVAYKIYALG
jgi:DNA replication and repair protein RecF